jgi:hypothetical protein
MKALAVLPPDPWMEINLLDTLRRRYCESLEVFHYPGGMGQLGSRSWRASRDRLNDELLILARRLKSSGKLDFLFFVVYDDFLLVETAEKLRELGVPMVNYHVDMVFQWYRVIRTAPYFTVLAVAQMANAEHLRPYNPSIEWMPMAANPEFYRIGGAKAREYQYDVSFVGSFDPFRRALLQQCVTNGIKPTVFGRGWDQHNRSDYQFSWDPHKIIHDLRYYGWPRWRAGGLADFTAAAKRKFSRSHQFEPLDGAEIAGPCSDEKMPSIFRSSRINLGFSDTGWHSQNGVVHSQKLQCRLRDFEVPMAGGFYLAQEAPDHHQYYKIGEEIDTWSEPGELVEKLGFYSRNIHAAERIREAGAKRALECHTWEHRFDRLFKRLGMPSWH